jgi:DNA modification methylase
MLINANALHIPLADRSVQCVVTSPPYWGLRSYSGTARWVGGDPNCNHSPERENGKSTSTLGGGQATNNHAQEPYKDFCRRCGSVRVDNQLGLEQTPELYVESMVQVFREVWRVLRDDGTLWLNLGDSYNGSGGAGGDYNAGGLKEGQPRYPGRNIGTLKPKDLVGIPWRVAFALQADGWYLRSDCIWAKPNPMPESVQDRPTKSHEYIFLLSKSQRYFYDADAVREPHIDFERGNNPAELKGHSGRSGGIYTGTREAMRGVDSDGAKRVYNPAGRNRRTVWNIATTPYSGAHFATYPPALVEPCIKAGTSEAGCCSVCGKPWERVINHTIIPGPKAAKTFVVDNRDLTADKNDQGSNRAKDGHKSGYISKNTTLGFRPTCTCDAPPRPCVVFDPFNGSGTTGLVARKLGRSYVGLDLSMDYLHLARERLGLTALDEWTNGKQPEDTTTHDDLPLFQALEAS